MKSFILLFQMEIVIYPIEPGIEITCDLICLTKENCTVMLIISNHYRQRYELQHEEAEKSKIATNEKEDIAHRVRIAKPVAD